MANLINWFEIPTRDLQRASAFYSKVLNASITPVSFAGFKMAMLPGNRGEVSGALVEHEAYTPSHQGTLIYLNGGNDLSDMLARAESAGAKILQSKRQISPEVGYMAMFEDTEGNRVAIHSEG